MSYHYNIPFNVPSEYAGRALICERCQLQRGAKCESQDGCNFIARGCGKVKDNPHHGAQLRREPLEMAYAPITSLYKDQIPLIAEIMILILRYDRPHGKGLKDLNKCIQTIEKIMEIEERKQCIPKE